MDPEQKISDCEFNLNQIKYFEPDPYYTRYFFEKYIKSIESFYQQIFEEANRDFGLFVKENCDKTKFTNKAIEKKDKKALEFVNWFNKKFDDVHVNIFPKFIKNTLSLYKTKKLSNIKIMLRAKERYKDDVFQEIIVPLSQGKIRSTDELKVEIQRQLPVFLELINHKRQKYTEPKVDENQVVASVFLDVGKLENMEIVYACQIYIPVMKQFLVSARNKIKHLTQIN